jgi:hypothetical protein
MSNRTDPQQLIGGQTAAGAALPWGTVQAVLAPPATAGTAVPVTAPTNT